MIRYIYDDSHGERVAQAAGTADEIAAELGTLIGDSYNLIRSRNPEAAELFRRCVMVSVLPDSPVWTKREIQNPRDGILYCMVKEGPT